MSRQGWKSRTAVRWKSINDCGRVMYVEAKDKIQSD